MIIDFSRLSSAWVEWNDLCRIPASVVTDCLDCQISFASDEQSFHLHEGQDWWTVDRVNDRGRRFDNTAMLSNFGLVEKYLIWNWASFARIVLGLPLCEPQLYKQGYSSEIRVSPTANQWRDELISPAGSAILPQSQSVIFSHFMSKSVDEIYEVETEGFPR